MAEKAVASRRGAYSLLVFSAMTAALFFLKVTGLSTLPWWVVLTPLFAGPSILTFAVFAVYLSAAALILTFTSILLLFKRLF